MRTPKYPMTQTEKDFIAFLQGLYSQWGESDFLDCLTAQDGMISYRQRIRLWSIPTKYNLSCLGAFPGFDFLATASFLIEALSSTYKQYWADDETRKLREAMGEQIKALTARRCEWLENVMSVLGEDDGREENEAALKSARAAKEGSL